MNNYYILSMDSLIKTFSIIDAGKLIKFSLETQGTKKVFKNIKNGDIILGYIGTPTNQVKYIFEVIEVDSENSIKVVKKYEVAEGVDINKEDLKKELIVSELVKIEKDLYYDIFRKMFEHLKKELDNDIEKQENKNKNFANNLELKGSNVLLYGVPGSGKSYTISKEYCDNESNIERIVFHPDYMNTDFIGQILPIIKEDKTITYDFTPGPFTRIMKKAYDNPDKHYYLIIEEINRGNAPAIFGDVFQLLDRDINGASSYSIKNYNVAKVVLGDDDLPIYIPSNLSILATMNTADQNVFTLDTAFQRRWIMRLIKNDFSNADHADKDILDTKITWKVFNTTINDFILANNASTMSSEDKRLGAYFITKDILESDNKTMFAEKVIKYLWDDAFKFARNKLFDSKYRSLEKVIEDFSNSEGFNRFDIFTSEVTSQIKNNMESEEKEKQSKNNSDKTNPDIVEQSSEDVAEE